jgi:hypothetical protein
MKNYSQIKRYYFLNNAVSVFAFSILFVIVWALSGFSQLLGILFVVVLVLSIVLGLLFSIPHMRNFKTLGSTTESLGFDVDIKHGTRIYSVGGVLRVFPVTFGLFHKLAKGKKISAYHLYNRQARRSFNTRGLPCTVFEMENNIGLSGVSLMAKQQTLNNAMNVTAKSLSSLQSTNIGNFFFSGMNMHNQPLSEKFNLLVVNSKMNVEEITNKLNEIVDLNSLDKQEYKDFFSIAFWDKHIICIFPGFLFSVEEWQNALSIVDKIKS